MSTRSATITRIHAREYSAAEAGPTVEVETDYLHRPPRPRHRAVRRQHRAVRGGRAARR
ncbi:MAG: hypothetical protein U0736_00800 [Gemmataceae bacterium]